MYEATDFENVRGIFLRTFSLKTLKKKDKKTLTFENVRGSSSGHFLKN